MNRTGPLGKIWTKKFFGTSKAWKKLRKLTRPILRKKKIIRILNLNNNEER